MRITVVGAILIVATVVAGVLLLFALHEAETRLANKENSRTGQDQPSPNRTGVEGGF